MAALSHYLPPLALAATIGAAIMAGLLFAFSNFVIQALLQMPTTAAMEAMQRVNVAIVNPLFLCVFVGTAALSVVLMVGAIPERHMWLIAGAALYLVGVVGITAAFNIPLNNTLAAASPATAAEEWSRFVSRWLPWNHVRTVCAVAAVACFAFGAFELGQAGAQ